jgi:hypothetical protein
MVAPYYILPKKKRTLAGTFDPIAACTRGRNDTEQDGRDERFKEQQYTDRRASWRNETRKERDVKAII